MQVLTDSAHILDIRFRQDEQILTDARFAADTVRPHPDLLLRLLSGDIEDDAF